MSWMFQLVRATTISRYKEMEERMRTFAERYGAEYRMYWSGCVIERARLKFDYKSGFNATHLAQDLQELLVADEWMLFAETVDSTVLGDPVRMHAITARHYSELRTPNLVDMIMDRMIDVEESLDDEMRARRLGSCGADSGSLGDT
jgi:hypothetical protein